MKKSGGISILFDKKSGELSFKIPWEPYNDYHPVAPPGHFRQLPSRLQDFPLMALVDPWL